VIARCEFTVIIQRISRVINQNSLLAKTNSGTARASSLQRKWQLYKEFCNSRNQVLSVLRLSHRVEHSGQKYAVPPVDQELYLLEHRSFAKITKKLMVLEVDEDCCYRRAFRIVSRVFPTALC